MDWLPRRSLLFLALLLTGHTGRGADLGVPRLATNGWIHITSPGAARQVHTLEASPDLHDWRELAVLHDGPFDFADVSAPTNGVRYLRLVSRPRTTQDDGKNQIQLPGDAFLEPPVPSDFNRPARLGWAKFTVLLADETRVWFQDSTRYVYHFDYARLRLPAFAGVNPDEFDRRTLHRAGQQAVLGAILVPPDASLPEYGIQFVGQDVWTREEIARWFGRVRAGVLAPPGTRAFYIPSFEQEAVALASRDWLAERGIEVASAARWLQSDAVYAEGWSVGRLVFVPGDRIQSAYAAGQLLPTDILLTDAVPAEVPYVAGIITLAPATPNSHVAILARGYGVPFVWFADPADQAWLRGLNGREIALRTGFRGDAPQVTDLSGQLTDPLRVQLAALKLPTPLRYPPKVSLGVWTTNVSTLTPADARFVGGKAANYGLLTRTIPNNCGSAIALTFDVWDAFLDQTLPVNRTLREEIDLQLGEFSYPPNMALLQERLETVQSRITRMASFSASQRAQLLAALTNGPFEPGRKLRFRSSTNVEDSEDFTGAGLYDSYSGCLLDDLDGDEAGPSACDPDETNERGVFRAIQKVYASFYNENAFLERLRRGVKENEVGMAVLVHHSYPDPDELANGVIVLHASRAFGDLGFYGEMVTQLGAVSVTNPDSAARPERVSFSSSGNFRSVDLRESSSLVPLGGYVMNWETDYRELIRLLERVTQGYGKLFPSLTEYSLDLEFKRIRPGRLEIKQVRRLPRAPTGRTVTPFLFGEPASWCVQEGEFGSPLAKHRLKGRFSATSDARRLDAAGLKTTLYRDAVLTFRHETQSITLTNGPVDWADFVHKVSGTELTDAWSWGEGTERKKFLLRTTVRTSVTADESAWWVLSDFDRTLQVTHATPQPEISWEGTTQTRVDDVVLVPCPERTPGDLLQDRVLNLGAVLSLHTQFWWPPVPTGPTAGYTAPNVGFIGTEITGLTTEPLMLRSPVAQTYSPGHHNFTETFVLEPRLDPGVTAAQIAELEAAGIRILLITAGFEGTEGWAINAAGQFRRLR